MFAEGLVMPLNPHRWPAYAAGSVASSEDKDFDGKIKTPLDNLIVAKEYIETAQSDGQWRARVWKVDEDTTAINVACEVGGDIGAFSAGAASNKVAADYMNEMYQTSTSLNDQEKLNMEIFKQTARDKNIDPDTVRGTGVARQFVPESMQGDLCDRPERNARPKPFDDDGLSEDGIITNPNQGGPFNNNNGDLNSFDGIDESSTFSLESNTNPNENNGSIFGRLCGSGSGSTVPDPDKTCLDVSNFLVSCDEPKRAFWDMLFGFFGFFIPEPGGSGICQDPTNASSSMPMFLGDYPIDNQSP